MTTTAEPAARRPGAATIRWALDNLVWFILLVIVAGCSIGIPGFFQTGIFLNIAYQATFVVHGGPGRRQRAEARARTGTERLTRRRARGQCGGADHARGGEAAHHATAPASASACARSWRRV